MTWRERARDAAESRLRGLRTGSEGPSPANDGAQATDDAAPAAVLRSVRTGPWTASAVRGLVVLIVPVVAVAAYLTWMAQPREVAPVPEIVAVGDPISGTLPVGPDTPAPDTPAPSAAASLDPAPAAGPPQTAAPVEDVIVHVAGQVARPGLVRLPGGSRVADAVEAAGGVTRPRAAESVNLARMVLDGEQIYVGADPRTSAAAPAGVGAVTNEAGPVDLNTATVEQLDALPGVGPVIAGRIVEWRSVHGRFRSVDELTEVSGIGEAMLADLRSRVRV